MDNWQTLNVLLPVDEQTLGFNLRLNPDLAMHKRMIDSFRRKALYDEGRSNFLFNVLRAGDIVIDVGAHIGYFSLLASAFVGKSGVVSAFEPEHTNFVQLQANVALNRATNMQVYELALGAAAKEVPFYVNLSGNDGAHSLASPDSRGRQTAYRTDTVQLATLDSVVGELGTLQIRLLKVAAAGAEADVLRGATNLLRNGKIDWVVSQFDSRAMRRMGIQEAELREFMLGHGYQSYGLMASADLIHVPLDFPIGGTDQDVNVTVVFARLETVRRLAEGR